MPRWSVVALAGTLAVINGASRVLTDNQNTYLLHALAHAGHGRLQSDWMAQTADLTPVFSKLVEVGYRLIGSPVLYLAQFAVAFIVFGSLLTIVRRHLRAGELLVVAAGLAMIVSPPARQLGLLDIAMRGVAGQYVVSTYIQPSDAGVLIVMAIAVHVSDVRHGSLLAAAACGAAAVLHPTYIIPGGVVAVAIAADQYRRSQDAAHSLVPLGLYTLVSAPLALRLLIDLPLADEAAMVLVHARIPHHTRPEVWFGLDDAARIGLVTLAVWLYRHDAVGVIVGVTGTLSLSASVAATALDNDRLLLMFPWRVSVVVVPISATLLLAWLIRHLSGISALRRLSRATLVASLVALIVLMGFSVRRFARSTTGSEPFASVPTGTYLIPPDEEDFRLASGQPVLVDAKTHPYRGDELLEWWRRVRAVRAFYDSGGCEPLSRVLERWPDVTHVLLPTTMPPACVGVRAGGIGSYDIYRVDRGPERQIEPARQCRDAPVGHVSRPANAPSSSNRSSPLCT